MRRMALWLAVGLAGLMLAGCVNPAEDIAEIKANPGGGLGRQGYGADFARWRGHPNQLRTGWE